MKNIPVVMIIFGGSGDLAHRKLYPALFNLYQKGLIHDHFAVIGTARRPWSHEYLQEQVVEAVKESCDNFDEKEAKEFASHFYYQSHDVTDIGHYIALKELAAKLDEKYQAEGNRIFYMAMAPRFFGTIATHINDQKLLGSGFVRISSGELVNSEKILRFSAKFSGTICVVLENGSESFVSRRQIPTIKRLFGLI